ncbi:unnamed protein product, partial [Ectocarpus sp. 12 AP-2014]
ALYGVDANLGHLRAIGARAFVHVETHKRKLNPKAWEGRLCGYSMDSKSFRIYNPEKGNVRESRNVIFIETPSAIPDPTKGSRSEDHEVAGQDLVANNNGPTSPNEESDHENSSPEDENTPAPNPAHVTRRTLRSSTQAPDRTRTRSTTKVGKPSATNQRAREVAVDAKTISELKRLALYTNTPLADIGHREEKLNFLEYAFVANNTQIHSRSEGEKVKTIPNNFKDAMGLPEAKLWKGATDKEMKSLQDLNVYKLVPRTSVPPGQKVIGSKW